MCWDINLDEMKQMRKQHIKHEKTAASADPTSTS